MPLAERSTLVHQISNVSLLPVGLGSRRYRWKALCWNASSAPSQTRQFAQRVTLSLAGYLVLPIQAKRPDPAQVAVAIGADKSHITYSPRAGRRWRFFF